MTCDLSSIKWFGNRQMSYVGEYYGPFVCACRALPNNCQLLTGWELESGMLNVEELWLEDLS